MPHLLGRSVGGSIGVAAVAGTLPIGVASGYLGLLTLMASTPRGRRRPPTVAPSNRFVVLIPAHDEEAVIAQALEAFACLDYPADLFSVHVVADNCSDRTAEIVREKGFAVHERRDDERPGKGPALNWLLELLDTSRVPFDVVVIVDADTTVDPAFLRRMNDAFCAGAVAAQGYYSVRDPGASATAGIRYAALACRHHLRPLGRAALGCSCGLFGNGMAFAREVMKGRQWSGHLIEDAEFQNELLLGGCLVTYVPDARVEAEMPDSRAAATSQNERWELGRLQLAKRYVPMLLRRSGQRDHLRAARLDAVIDHLVPPLSVLVAANWAMTAVSTTGALLGDSRSARAAVVNVASAAVITAHVLVGLRSVHAPRSVYRSLAAAPRMILWKANLWRRVLARPDRVSWKRTQRNVEGTP